MSGSRAPLFSVSLAFATGCLLGLDNIVSWHVAVVFVVIAIVSWLRLKKREGASLIAFYVLVICAGLTHTLLVTQSISPDDLRRLSAEKSLGSTQWRGRIVEEPSSQISVHAARRTQDRTQFILQVEAWRPTGGRMYGGEMDVPWQPAKGQINCTILGPANDLQLGDRIEFAAPLAPPAQQLTPGGLDFREFEARRDVYYETTIPAMNWRPISREGGGGWQDLSYRARDWAYARLQIGLEDDPRTADFLAGMLIGYRKEIPRDIEQDFRRTGTIHVFAVSGQNIAEMVVVALILLQLCGLVRWRWAWTTAPFVLLYCLLTGSPASAVRATFMALAILFAWRLGKPISALNCWSLALFILLLWNPEMLLDPGAQLSFAIVLGLILIAPPIVRFLLRPFQPDPFLPPSLLTDAQRFEKRGWWLFVGLIGTGIAAVLMSEPITAIEFHQVTPISILANLVVVPAAGLITCIGTLSVAVSLVNSVLAAWLNNTNWLLARGLILFVGFLAHKPDASVNVADLSTLALPQPDFIVAPVQDSACLLVRTPEETWLFNAGRETLAPAAVWHLLQFYGINRLDGLVLAQMSAPDNGGAAAITRDFHPRHLVVPVLTTKSPLQKTLPELAVISGRENESWKEGESYPLGQGVTVEVLHPSADSDEAHAEDRALVLLFHQGNQSLLWAGRIGADTQRYLLAAHPNLHADVLVMGTQAQDAEWLSSLGVRDWLQMPARERTGSFFDSTLVPRDCRIWALNATGSVEIHFAGDHLVLRPWAGNPF